LREFESGEPVVEELASVKWIESELVRRALPTSSAALTSNAAPAPRSASIWERLSLWAEDLAPPRRRFALSMAGVSLLLIAGAGIYLQRGGEPPLTNPAAPAVWRSLRFAAIGPVGDLTQAPAVFQWEAVPGAAKYAIHLRGVDGVEVWSEESAQTTIAPPQAIRSMLTGGRAFHWTVDARNAAGEKMASTDSQTFHILATTR
jgi:hypothetical protein